MTTNIMEPNEPAPLAPPSADSAGQPVSAGTLRDQAIFQHVVGDNSQLDETATGDNPEISGDESDNSDPDSDDGNSIHGFRHYLIDSSDLSNDVNNQRAISLQISKRLHHDLPKVLPILHGISSILDTRIAINTDEPVVTEFRDVLTKLSDQLDKVHLTPRDPSLPIPLEALSSTRSANESTRRASGLVTRKHILPPSPEAKQKRKKSHGIL